MDILQPKTSPMFPFVQNMINNRLVRQSSRLRESTNNDAKYLWEFCTIIVDGGRQSGHTTCMEHLVSEYPNCLGICTTTNMSNLFVGKYASSYLMSVGDVLSTRGNAPRHNMIVFDNVCVVQITEFYNDHLYNFLDLDNPVIIIQLGCR